MLAVVFLLTASVLVLVQARIRTQVRADLASTMRTESRVYAEIERIRREQSQQSAELIAGQSSLKALMSTNDRPTVEDGSLTDLTIVLGQDVTATEVNEAFEQASTGRLNGILRYSTDPLVSRDIIGDTASCVFDSGLTQASGSLAKVFGWYDNEWGYTCRLADLASIVGAQL